MRHPSSSTLGVTVGALLIGACSSEEGRPRFRTAPAERRTLVETVEASGRVEAMGRTLVHPAIEGRLLEVLVEPGATVEEGAVLARLDAAPFRRQLRSAAAAVDLAEARLAEARAVLSDAEREAARMKRLAARGRASDAELEGAQGAAARARAGAAAARAQLEQARAAREGASENRDAAEIVAPRSGVVLTAPEETGGLVTPRAPLFVLADELTTLRVTALVGEADIGRLGPDARREVEVEAEAYPGEVFVAQLERRGIVPAESAGIARYPVHLLVQDPSRRLLPGMRAIVRFEAARDEDALAVPLAALRFSPPGAPEAPPRSRVFVLNGSSSVEAVPVRPGLSDGLAVEIEPTGAREISAGDRVVIGYETAREGRAGAPNLSIGGK